MDSAPMIPLTFDRRDADEIIARADELRSGLRSRRSVRHFSSDPVPLEALRAAIDAAGQAPSGANKQPWTFCLVTDPMTKRAIREAAEEEERAFYGGRASEEWLEDLRPFRTNADKPFLEDAPALIVVFAQSRGAAGEKHYYVKESVGIACGFLLATLHLAGLATLTHTPSPMGFLGEVLGRPDHERAFLLVPVGYPAEGCEVPAIARKGLEVTLVER